MWIIKDPVAANDCNLALYCWTLLRMSERQRTCSTTFARRLQVGAEVARRAQGLGLTVIAHDPFASEERARALGVRLVPFDEALGTADFFSLHMPLTPGTKACAGEIVLVAYCHPSVYLPPILAVIEHAPRCVDHMVEVITCRADCLRVINWVYVRHMAAEAHGSLRVPQEMFNDDAFAKIKKGARIVNVARGGVIDDAALARALDSGAVAQAHADHDTHAAAGCMPILRVHIWIIQHVERAVRSR